MSVRPDPARFFRLERFELAHRQQHGNVRRLGRILQPPRDHFVVQRGFRDFPELDETRFPIFLAMPVAGPSGPLGALVLLGESLSLIGMVGVAAVTLGPSISRMIEGVS